MVAVAIAVATEFRLDFRFNLSCDLRDFPNYYYAAKAREAGLSPYDIISIRERWGEYAFWMYPAILTHVFAPLTDLDVVVAGAVFTAIKVVCLCLTFIGWRRALPLLKGDPLFIGFAVLGLNLTLFHDVCNGNVAVFEAVFLAWGFYFLLAGRLGWFFVLAAIAGMWKLVPLGLVCLAPLLYPRRRLAWVGPPAIAAVALGLFGMWWSQALADAERWLTVGQFALSLRTNYFELFKHLFWLDAKSANLAPWPARPEIYAYAIVFVAIGLTTLLAWKRSLEFDGESVRLWRLLLGITAFAALAPGAFTYSHVYILPVVYLALRFGLAARWPYWPLAVVGFVIAFTPTYPWLFLAGKKLAIYQPLFAITIAWLLILPGGRDFSNGTRIPA